MHPHGKTRLGYDRVLRLVMLVTPTHKKACTSRRRKMPGVGQGIPLAGDAALVTMMWPCGGCGYFRGWVRGNAPSVRSGIYHAHDRVFQFLSMWTMSCSQCSTATSILEKCLPPERKEASTRWSLR